MTKPLKRRQRKKLRKLVKRLITYHTGDRPTNDKLERFYNRLIIDLLIPQRDTLITLMDVNGVTTEDATSLAFVQGVIDYNTGWGDVYDW